MFCILHPGLNPIMAVQRIEWQCPGCQRKFAIPDQSPRPQLCPQCQKARPTRTAPLITDEIDEEEDAFAAVPRTPLPEPPTPSGSPRRPVKPRRYEVLRTISLWFKILAGLIAFVFVIALVALGIRILQLAPGFEQRMLFFQWVVTSISGITIVLFVYAFAVLLVVAMDIEYNTRDE